MHVLLKTRTHKLDVDGSPCFLQHHICIAVQKQGPTSQTFIKLRIYQEHKVIVLQGPLNQTWTEQKETINFVEKSPKSDVTVISRILGILQSQICSKARHMYHTSFNIYITTKKWFHCFLNNYLKASNESKDRRIKDRLKLPIS
jgi:hypothetical protein